MENLSFGTKLFIIISNFDFSNPSISKNSQFLLVIPRIPIRRHPGPNLIGQMIFALAAVFFLKAFNAASSIDQLLLARKERMTFRANFKAKISLGRSGLKCLPTSA